MRGISPLKRSISVLLGLAPIAFAVSGLAAPPQGGGPALPPTARPKIDLPARIVSIKRPTPRGGGPAPKYTSGPIAFEVEVAAPTLTPLNTNIVFNREWLNGVVKVPVSAPAGGRVTVTLLDDKGLRATCAPSDYTVSFESAPDIKSVWSVTPHCSFQTTVVDPLAPVPPDTKAAQRANRLSYLTPTLDPASFACGGANTMTAVVKNAGSADATNVSLAVEGPVPFENGDNGPFVGTLKPGQSATAKVVYANNAQTGQYLLKVKGTGVPTFQPGWHVDVAISCSPEVDRK